KHLIMSASSNLKAKRVEESPPDVPLALRPTLLMALAMAVVWWLATFIIRQTGILHVWTDQSDKFTLAATHFFDPYSGMSGFFSPPWAVLTLAPLEWLPLEMATLVQVLIYFGLLALIAHRFEIRRMGWLVLLLSPLALDAVLELNIDWIAAIGLVVPAEFSLIFLSIKPQAFPGYVFTLTWKQLVRAAGILSAVLLLSFVVWGPNWLLGLYTEFGTRSLALGASLSLWIFMPRLVSIALGLALLAFAFYRHDAVLKILAGVFFTPYLPTYSAIIPFMFLCIRFPRVGLLVCFALWLLTLAILGPLFW
ncbi:MAG: hypothetical protein L0Z53_21255, partial [Acidobacteriales bacterium]|nr:hypothetical protein [Terriglobales bacterium]